MKERPILFSAPMVRAILEGRKTQTRRIVKPATLEAIEFMTGRADEEPARSADLGLFYDRPEVEDSRGRTRSLKHPQWLVFNAAYPEEGSLPIGQGYGAVGDRLWVRETWRVGAWDEDEGQFAIDYRDGPDMRWRSDERDDTGEKFNDLWLSCCDELSDKDIHPNSDGRYEWKPGESPLRWRPSIHMPRWASRISLEVTGIRVERLQEISENDAADEGVGALMPAAREGNPDQYRETFMELWESINGKGSWAASPWCWVVEFKRVTP